MTNSPRRAPALLRKHGAKVLVFRNGMIGNTLYAEPMFRKLKELNPSCSISVVVDELGYGLLRAVPEIDALYVFNKKRHGLKVQWGLVRQWRRERFDVSLHLRSGTRNELLAFLSGIPCRVGTRLKGLVSFLNECVPDYKDGHMLHINESFLSGVLGQAVRLDPPRLHVDRDDMARVEVELRKHGVTPGNYVVVHPAGATCNGLSWSLPAYAALVDRLRDKFHAPVVILGAPNEREAVEGALVSGDGVIPFFQADVGLLTAIISRAGLFIGNDSGPAHIAEALEVPKVVVYGEGERNFTKWRPLDESRSRIVWREELASDGLERIAGLAAELGFAPRTA